MKIVKVNNLPQTYEADTIYLVKSSTAGLMDIYVTDNTGTQIRSLAIDGNGIIPLGYAPIRNWDLSRGYMFKMTIEGNTVLNLPSNLRPGSWVMYVKQDAVGGHRMDFQAGYYGPRGLLPVLSTLPNAVDILTFISDGEHLAVSIQANLALA